MLVQCVVMLKKWRYWIHDLTDGSRMGWRVIYPFRIQSDLRSLRTVTFSAFLHKFRDGIAEAVRWFQPQVNNCIFGHLTKIFHNDGCLMLILWFCSKFIVHLSLFFFVFFFSLRLDETIQWSWWIVFLPIWIWKVLVFLGAAIGTFIWLKNPQSR